MTLGERLNEVQKLIYRQEPGLSSLAADIIALRPVGTAAASAG
jgi:hypothetical protein